MSISTKGVQKNYISKEIKPGNVTAKINNISIEKSKQPRDPEVDEWKIYMEIESKPVGDEFVGFDKVFGDPSKGQFKGQIKKIQASNWPFKDASGVSKNTGKPYEILASAQILNLLQRLLSSVGEKGWLEANDGKFETWEEMFSAINRAGLFKDKYLSWCLAATESVNAKGYTVYYIYVPDRKQAQTPFGPEGSLVTSFDPAVHIKKSAKLEESTVLNSEETSSEDLGDFANDSDDDDLFDVE
tara:strand:- start:7592 stop:8320 length:729 start_codon:yes stop_codon:yes gene_type:complete